MLGDYIVAGRGRDSKASDAGPASPRDSASRTERSFDATASKRALGSISPSPQMENACLGTPGIGTALSCIMDA